MYFSLCSLTIPWSASRIPMHPWNSTRRSLGWNLSLVRSMADFWSWAYLLTFLFAENAFSDFTLYFLGYDHSNGEESAEVKASNRTNREGAFISCFPTFSYIIDILNSNYTFTGVLELTHNHGTENDANFKGYHNGNSDPRGFGHIAFVPYPPFTVLSWVEMPLISYIVLPWMTSRRPANASNSWVLLSRRSLLRERWGTLRSFWILMATGWKLFLPAWSCKSTRELQAWHQSKERGEMKRTL